MIGPEGVWHDARMPAALTLALAGALALTAYAGEIALLLAVLVVQGLLASGWHRTLDVPGSVGGMVLAGGAALAADILLLLRDEARPLAPIAGVLGVAVLGAMVHQLLRGPARSRVTASLTATTMLVVLGTLAALFLAAAQTRGGAALVALAALAAAISAAVDQVALPPLVVAGIATVGGILLGAVAAALTELSLGPSLLLGGAAAATAVSVMVFVRRAERPDLTTVAALPLTGVAPLAYVLGRILVG